MVLGKLLIHTEKKSPNSSLQKIYINEGPHSWDKNQNFHGIKY